MELHKNFEGKKEKKHFLAIENFKNKIHFWVFDLNFFSGRIFASVESASSMRVKIGYYRC
jgi:hypothetical protein